MPQYKYTAYDIRGKKYKGKKEFSTEAEFRKFLKSKRMILIKFEILKKNKKIFWGFFENIYLCTRLRKYPCRSYSSVG